MDDDDGEFPDPAIYQERLRKGLPARAIETSEKVRLLTGDELIESLSLENWLESRADVFLKGYETLARIPTLKMRCLSVFIVECARCGIRFVADGDRVSITQDAWATPFNFGKKFRLAMEKAEGEILLICMSEAPILHTPESCLHGLNNMHLLTDVERAKLLRDAFRLNVLHGKEYVPGDSLPALHEDKDTYLRRTAADRVMNAIRVSETLRKEDEDGVIVELDPSPFIAWIKCTYTKGKNPRSSCHWFVDKWWEGEDGVRCTCKAKQFNPSVQCKHEVRRDIEYMRRNA